MRTFVLGDIHGAYKAFLQCLDRSGFDYENDLLIQLGDVVDGYPQAYECVEELLKIKKLVAIKGNHDDWFNEFIISEYHPYFWNHGGKGTLISYLEHAGKQGQLFLRGNGYKTGLTAMDIPKSHQDFFAGQRNSYIDDHNRCYVHGGFDRSLPIDRQDATEFYWDRSLWSDAVSLQANGGIFHIATKFHEIYIGHSPTQKWDCEVPMKAFNIYNIDTGAGHQGRLSMMDVDGKLFCQSDRVTELYPDYALEVEAYR